MESGASLPDILPGGGEAAVAVRQSPTFTVLLQLWFSLQDRFKHFLPTGACVSSQKHLDLFFLPFFFFPPPEKF